MLKSRYIKRFAIVLNLQLFLCFFLLAVSTDDTQITRCQYQSHATKLFIG